MFDTTCSVPTKWLRRVLCLAMILVAVAALSPINAPAVYADDPTPALFADYSVPVNGQPGRGTSKSAPIQSERICSVGCGARHRVICTYVVGGLPGSYGAITVLNTATTTTITVLLQKCAATTARDGDATEGRPANHVAARRAGSSSWSDAAPR
jgi:hypothetical protein